MEEATEIRDRELARLSVRQYHAMLEAGILRDGDPIELIDGLLVNKVTKHPPHVMASTLLAQELSRAVPAGWHVRIQDPITTADSEPEPDLAVVRGGPRRYVTAHPGPADVGLVVEVADDSLARDRGLKLRVYARAGITRYWLVNLRARVVEVYSAPNAEGFGEHRDLAPGESLVLDLDGEVVARIPVDAILP